MKDKWTAGPKFNEYLSMNFHLVAGYYAAMLALSCIGLGIVSYLLLFSALTKLYSQTLYHKQACLYQSVPVSSFETVLVKTVVGVIGFLIPAVVTLGITVLKSVLDGSQLELYEQLKEMGLMFHTGAGTVLYMLNLVMASFLLCGIALFGVAVGNRARGNRDKKPNAATAVLVIGGLLLVLYGIVWIMEQIQFSSPLLREILKLVGCTAGAGSLFWLNVRALDKWYSI